MPLCSCVHCCSACAPFGPPPTQSTKAALQGCLGQQRYARSNPAGRGLWWVALRDPCFQPSRQPSVCVLQKAQLGRYRAAHVTLAGANCLHTYGIAQLAILTCTASFAVIVALAEASYTWSQLPESTSGRPNILVSSLSSAAVTAVCPCPACLLASNQCTCQQARLRIPLPPPPFEPLQRGAVQLLRRCAGQKQTRQKSALSTHSQAMLCSGVHLLLQGRRAPYRWIWVTTGSAWCLRSAAASCRRSDTA